MSLHTSFLRLNHGRVQEECMTHHRYQTILRAKSERENVQMHHVLSSS